MSPLTAAHTVVTTITAHAHAPYRARRPADPPASLPRKDFGAMPVCGSVRPLASQRDRAGLG